VTINNLSPDIQKIDTEQQRLKNLGKRSDVSKVFKEKITSKDYQSVIEEKLNKGKSLIQSAKSFNQQKSSKIVQESAANLHVKTKTLADQSEKMALVKDQEAIKPLDTHKEKLSTELDVQKVNFEALQQLETISSQFEKLTTEDAGLDKTSNISNLENNLKLKNSSKKSLGDLIGQLEKIQNGLSSGSPVAEIVEEKLRELQALFNKIKQLSNQ